MKITSVAYVLGFALIACTGGRTYEPVPAEGGRQGQQTGPQSGRSGDVTQQNSGDAASLPVTLDEGELRNYALDTSALTYKFSYVDVKRDDKITFTDGKSKLDIKDLPIGKTGDMTLELLEAGTLRMRGVASNQTLVKGPNTVNIALKLVDGETTDVTLVIEFGGATGGSTPTETVTQAATSTSTAAATSTTTGNTGGGNGPSYKADILPIMEAACSECHHAGGTAPNLMKPFGGDVAEKVIRRATASASSRMPPGVREPLSQKQVDTLKAWKDAGAKP